MRDAAVHHFNFKLVYTNQFLVYTMARYMSRIFCLDCHKKSIKTFPCHAFFESTPPLTNAICA